MGRWAPTPEAPRTAAVGARELHANGLVKEVLPFTEVVHSIPGDRLPKPVRERPTDPFEGRPPGEFLKGDNVAKTRMTFFRASVRRVRRGGLGRVRRGRGPGKEFAAAKLGGSLEALRFDREVRVRDMLCGESMISSDQRLGQDRVHDSSILGKNLFI